MRLRFGGCPAGALTRIRGCNEYDKGFLGLCTGGYRRLGLIVLSSGRTPC